MSNQTVNQFLYVKESYGNASYFLFDYNLDDTNLMGYTLIGKVEVPAVSKNSLKEMAIGNINEEIAKADMVLKSLQIKKQTLLAIEHKPGG